MSTTAQIVWHIGDGMWDNSDSWRVVLSITENYGAFAVVEIGETFSMDLVQKIITAPITGEIYKRYYQEYQSLSADSYAIPGEMQEEGFTMASIYGYLCDFSIYGTSKIIRVRKWNADDTLDKRGDSLYVKNGNGLVPETVAYVASYLNPIHCEKMGVDIHDTCGVFDI